MPVYLNVLFSIGLYTPVMWIGNGGSTGSFQYYIFVYATFVISVIRNKRMIFLILGLIVLMSVFLLWYEYQYPEFIYKYTNPTERFYDLLIGFISVLIGISALFYVYTNEYTKTNKELNIKNQQLQDHNEELEQHKNEIEKQRFLLENQNYHINESLNYARRIQKAVLSSYRVLRRQVSDSFLFYLPKERISGDFYYFAKKGDILYIVVADSTGHGVPGGFMSMLGITMLEEIVNRGEIKSSGSALDKLREKIIGSLNKEPGGSINTGDGFDMAFCMVDFRQMRMNYSGANIPLLLCREHTILTFEADEMPVGKFIDMRAFDDHYIDLQRNDALYLYTDGITDQFGRDKISKFSTERLKILLSEISDEPMALQKEKFKKVFRDWKGSQKRTDDSLILGVRF